MDQFGLYPEAEGNRQAGDPVCTHGHQRSDGKGRGNACRRGSGRRKEKRREEEGIDIEAKPEITFDDFAKLQFQVGEIIACEAVKKSKKLLCSQVKIGSQVKQIVIRYQGPLHSGRDGRQEGYGCCELKTC